MEVMLAGSDAILAGLEAILAGCYSILVGVEDLDVLEPILAGL